ncbi:MAG TPA: outer membrane protein transport protein [Pseudomonadota bacterium]|nr:outer membrane protein transport protein [Pseudomonadota bacterium]
MTNATAPAAAPDRRSLLRARSGSRVSVGLGLGLGLGFGLATAVALYSGAAHAGGFELPANGTEALGRGGAFTAKADSPLALEYNVGGLAQLRGTRVLFDNNLYFSEYSFQRAGGDSIGAYPLVRDQAAPPFYAPWFGLTTDFGYFRRWTFAVGAYGPSSVGARSFGVFSPAESGTVRPTPSRYDLEQSNLLIVFPTVAVAVRVHRVLDLGISGQQVTSQINVASATYAPTSIPIFPSSAACSQQPEVAGCDTTTRVQVSSYDNFTLQFGALLHPLRELDIGLHVRSAVNLGMYPIRGKGTVSASEPPFLRGAQLGADHMNAQFDTWLPWVFRAGVRYAYRKGDFELFDLELDGTYEAWSLLDGSDNHLTLLNPPLLVNKGMPLTITIPHSYKDTFSLRLGGAVNYPTSVGQLTLRLGALYDSSATRDANVRVDFDTLAKIGATIGVGINIRGVTLNLAYAYLASLQRTVDSGELRAIDGTSGKAVQLGDDLAPAVNNGIYSGHNHVASIGITILFDDLVRGHGWLKDHPR